MESQKETISLVERRELLPQPSSSTVCKAGAINLWCGTAVLCTDWGFEELITVHMRIERLLLSLIFRLLFRTCGTVLSIIFMNSVVFWSLTTV
jgi:hypothetical protein